MDTFNMQGMGVALVTPFKADKSIDFEALGRLIEFQIESQADYLVVLGTTGETPTLSEAERQAIKDYVRKKAAGRIPLVLGCGGYNTMGVVEELRTGDFDGFAAILSVVPAYNKPTQDGIYHHFSAIAEASPLPVILYNVPGRTAVNMTAETTLMLARSNSKFIGIKEASGNLTQIEEIIKFKPEAFQVVSGDDGITYPLMAMGAVGVISVVGNAFPKEFGRMVRMCLDGDFQGALKIHFSFTELFKLMFVDGNPAGVKCTLNALGMMENELRLPLVPTRVSTGEKIHHVLENIKSPGHL